MGACTAGSLSPAQFSFSFPRPNSSSAQRGPRSLLSFSFRVADRWAPLVGRRLPRAEFEQDSVESMATPSPSLVSPALISRRLDSFDPQPKTRALRVAIAANPRFDSPPSIRALETAFVAFDSSSRLPFSPLSRALSCSCDLAVVPEPLFAVVSLQSFSQANHDEKPSSLASDSLVSGEVPAERRRAPPRKLPL
nr:unnamed protein product [Digitaria exilis]